MSFNIVFSLFGLAWLGGGILFFLGYVFGRRSAERGHETIEDFGGGPH